jgi:hypothetical protein
MVYSKAKLKSGGDRASPCFRPLWIGKLSDKYLPAWTLVYLSFKHILINLTSFMGTDSQCSRRPRIFIDVAMWEQSTFDSEVFRCGKIY